MSKPTSRAGSPRVVIVGAGFAGLAAARHLRRSDALVTIIDRHNFHLFTPLLYEVGTALLDPSDIAYPVRGLMRRWRNCQFVMSEVTAISLGTKEVRTPDGPVDYDYLVLAAGSATNFFGIPGAAENTFALKDLGEALALRNHVLHCFEQASSAPRAEDRRALTTFVVVGGGPSGVEFAGALSELVHLVLRKDYPNLDMNEVTIELVEAAPHLLGAFAAPLRTNALRRLSNMGVSVRLEASVSRVTPEAVSLHDGSTVFTRTVVWTAGIRASPLSGSVGEATGRGGRLAVAPTLQLPGHPEVYVLGDMASFLRDDREMPQLASVAQQQGRAAATNIRRQLDSLAPVPFQYRDRGTMATIGRNSAIVDIRGVHLTGFAGWITWLTVHLILLVTFRNRLLVLFGWAYDYFFYDRPVRLLLEARREDRGGPAP